MAGQVWSTNTLGGYMFSETLSDILRMALQPLMRFRQHCFIDNAIGKQKGETHHWNTYSKVATAGRALSENETMPETNFTISQGSLTIGEYGKRIAALISSFMNKFCPIVVG